MSALQPSWGSLRVEKQLNVAASPWLPFLGYLAGGVDNDSLNIIYNIADLVNKTAFGLAIWYAATQDSK